MKKPQRPRTVFRPLDGLLLLDKPAGLSSNQALQQVRHLFRAAKGGHTGSLDPLATGLLPICFGEATKIAGLLLGACYLVLIPFGTIFGIYAIYMLERPHVRALFQRTPPLPPPPVYQPPTHFDPTAN